MQEMHCLINGRVQNVAYRVYAEDAATELGLVGWVRNLPDGRVEILAQGELDKLKEFVEHLHEGSLLAVVEGVDVSWQSVKEEHSDFSIRHD